MTAAEFTVNQSIRMEALNIASREAVVRAYPGASTIDIAQDMIEFMLEDKGLEELVQDKMAEHFEKQFMNACVNDMFRVLFKRPAPCNGEHPKGEGQRPRVDVDRAWLPE